MKGRHVDVTFDERGDVLTYTLLRCRDEEELRRLFKAMMLATSAEVLDALLADESVPVDKLDQTWLRRFGKRAA